MPTSMATVLVCDLGGTWLRVALLDGEGSVGEKEVIPTPLDDPAALVRTMRSVAARAKQPIAGAVIGVPGLVDYSRGEVFVLPNIPKWEGTLSAARLSAELGLSVFIVNDADLAALGEQRYGGGRGFDDVLYVTSSTGVGAGVVLGGRLLHGKRSLAEAGHTIIEHSTGATLEELASGSALERAAGADAADVAARAAAGDPEAARHFANAADAFATGVLNLVHCFAPEVVVIGGGMSRAGDLLLGPVRDKLAQRGLGGPEVQPRVVVAQAGDDAGLRGGRAYWADSTEGE